MSKKIIAGVAAVAIAGTIVGGAFLSSSENDTNPNDTSTSSTCLTALDQQAQDSKQLDESTLGQCPDSRDTVMDILNSDAFAGKYVIVELAAKWCPACNAMKPEMDAAFANLSAQGANIARITVYYQEEDGTAAYERTVAEMMLGDQSGRKGFPETQIWKDGEYLGHFGGAVPREQIEAIMKQNFKDLIPTTQSSQLAPTQKPA